MEQAKINAKGGSVFCSTIKQPNTNLVDVSDTMHDKLTDLHKILPPDVSIQPYYVQADFVKTSIKSVSDSLWLGLGLAIIVAIIFLRSLKASTTILITIPITICLTLIVLYVIGYTLNIMTLGALAAAIGLIIDDAIVVVERYTAHMKNSEEATVTLYQSGSISTAGDD